jgi:hypothetical protein
MSADANPELDFAIGHVLFIDVVGYSKLLLDDQRAVLAELNRLVRGTEPFRAAEETGKLTRLPTGDRTALRSSLRQKPRCVVQWNWPRRFGNIRRFKCGWEFTAGQSVMLPPELERIGHFELT